MSTRTQTAPSVRTALYEAPGPRAKRRIAIGTAISAVLLALLAALVVRQFYVTGRLPPLYLSFLL